MKKNSESSASRYVGEDKKRRKPSILFKQCLVFIFLLLLVTYNPDTYSDVTSEQNTVAGM